MRTIVVPVRACALLMEDFELAADGAAVDSDYLTYDLNEWDAAALDAASQLGDEVVAVSVGGGEVEGVLREALALGASRAVRIEPGPDAEDPLVIARLLGAMIAREAPDAVLAGVQSRDHGGSAVPAALGAYLGWPCATVVSGIRADADDPSAFLVTRELEAGVLQHARVALPAVLSIQTGEYEYRYPSFLAKRKAASADVPVLDAGDLGIDADELDAIRGCTRIRLEQPKAASTAVVLTGSPADVAGQILAIIREKVR